MTTHRATVPGISRLLTAEKRKIADRRIGLLAHPASVDGSLTHTLARMREAGAVPTVLFGPEHGFGGAAQDMEAVSEEPRRGGIPTVSLYGATEETLSPRPEMLRELDVLLVDLQDVGARYYTFVWTALLALRRCRDAGIEMIVTDRPNPLGGISVEGPPQSAEFLSFVGLKSVAVRHGMTVGEILSMAAQEEGLSEYLTVVPMAGWRREMLWEDTGLPWVMPSPNMPTTDTATVYPGMCLIEGTMVSEGRGTTRPFELVGAPGVNGDRLAARLSKMRLPGVRFRPAVFTPGFQKHAGERCGGVQLHVTDRRTFLPYRTGVAVLVALKAALGDAFVWRESPYEFVSDTPAIDLLAGSDTVRRMVEDGADTDDIAASWDGAVRAFAELRRPHLLY